MSYRFEAFEFDGQLGRLIGPEGEVHLRPQTFRVLATLIEEAPGVVSSNELVDRAWKIPYVSTDSVRQTLSELRRALGDDAQSSRIIQTVHRRGYRFIATLSEQPRDVAGDTASGESPALPSPKNDRAPFRRAFAMAALFALILFSIALLAAKSLPSVEHGLASSPQNLRFPADSRPQIRQSDELTTPSQGRRTRKRGGKKIGGRKKKGHLMKLNSLRLKRIDELLESGVSKAEIARELEISERSVYRAAKLLDEMPGLGHL